jgi:hypothetical protein
LSHANGKIVLGRRRHGLRFPRARLQCADGSRRSHHQRAAERWWSNLVELVELVELVGLGLVDEQLIGPDVLVVLVVLVDLLILGIIIR